MITRLGFFGLFGILVGLLSCAPQQGNSSSTSSPVRVSTKSPELRQRLLSADIEYMSGSPEAAERAAKQIVEILDDVPRGYEHSLTLWYSRLYLLNKMRKNQDLADINYSKARYWFLLERESRTNMTDAVVADEIRRFTPRECAKLTIEWDLGVAKNTNVTAPSYWSNLSQGDFVSEKWLNTTYAVDDSER